MIRALFAAIPLLSLPVIAYGVLSLTLGGGLMSPDAPSQLAAPMVRFATRAGGSWPISPADILLAASLLVAFLDLLKGAADRRVAIANHALSISLFVVCLAAMLLSPAFAGSTFFLMTLMVLLDLVAGFIVAIAPAQGPSDRRGRG